MLCIGVAMANLL